MEVNLRNPPPPLHVLAAVWALTAPASRHFDAQTRERQSTQLDLDASSSAAVDLQWQCARLNTVVLHAQRCAAATAQGVARACTRIAGRHTSLAGGWPGF